MQVEFPQHLTGSCSPHNFSAPLRFSNHSTLPDAAESTLTSRSFSVSNSPCPTLQQRLPTPSSQPPPRLPHLSTSSFRPPQPLLAKPMRCTRNSDSSSASPIDRTRTMEASDRPSLADPLPSLAGRRHLPSHR